MDKIKPEDQLAKSADIVSENIAQLQSLFPEAFVEGKIDFEVLKQLLGGAVEEREEKYGLNWHGKRAARQLALTPSMGTLRPCPEESVDWDTTQNLMIEGDNLEVLKLLQKSYTGKVKLIYIDPPYNTGSDFVYSDDFQDNILNYQIKMGFRNEDGSKVSSLANNAKSSGRFHTDWLNMIYPRLVLAHWILSNDGVIFISIDDNENFNLRMVCENIFGGENFIGEMIWEGANKNDANNIGIAHEYVLVYAKNKNFINKQWSIRKDGVDKVLKEVERLRVVYGEDYSAASKDLAGWFRSMKATSVFSLRRFRNIDGRGAYKEDDPTAPGGRKFDLKNPLTGELIPLRANRGWSFDQSEFERLVQEGRISFISDTSIMVRRYLHETDSLTPPSVFYQPARSATERLSRLMDDNIFDFPKDEGIIKSFIEMIGNQYDGDDFIVMDFFAGSGTTAESVMIQNTIDNHNRRFILVQLPEALDISSKGQKKAATYCDKLSKPRYITELTKERLRRAGKKIREQNQMFAGDTGFRVFKLDSSNIRAWNPDRDNLSQSLMDHIEHILPGRTEADILYEVLLKLGLDLCVPMEKRVFAGKDVHAIGGGVLLACLNTNISRDDVEALGLGIVAWHKELAPAGESTVVFRDNGFADDVAKTNLTAILHQNGLTNVRSL